MRPNEGFDYEHLQLPSELQLALSSLPEAMQAVIRAGLSEALQYFSKTYPAYGASDVTSMNFRTNAAESNTLNAGVIISITKKGTGMWQLGDLTMMGANLSKIEAVVTICFPGDGHRYDSWISRFPLNAQLHAAIKKFVSDNNNKDESREDDIPATTINRQDTTELSGWRDWLKDIFG